MKKFVLLALTISFSVVSNAQSFTSPYRLGIQADIPLAVTGTSFLTASYLMSTQKKLPPKEALQLLDRNEVNRFDRGATRQNSKVAAYISDATMYTAMALPLLHLINKDSRKDFGKVAAMGAEVLVVNIGITNLVKESVGRKRPLLYNPEVPMEKKLKKDNFKSFFSGHTSTVASMSFFFAQSFADYNPHSKLKPMVWSLSAALPIVTGVLRYKAGKHYWTDVIVGYVVGAAIGVGVPWLHKTAVGINK